MVSSEVWSRRRPAEEELLDVLAEEELLVDLVEVAVEVDFLRGLLRVGAEMLVEEVVEVLLVAEDHVVLPAVEGRLRWAREVGLLPVVELEDVLEVLEGVRLRLLGAAVLARGQEAKLLCCFRRGVVVKLHHRGCGRGSRGAVRDRVKSEWLRM